MSTLPLPVPARQSAPTQPDPQGIHAAFDVIESRRQAERDAWTPHYRALRDGIGAALAAAGVTADCLTVPAAAILRDRDYGDHRWNCGDESAQWRETVRVPAHLMHRIDEIVDLIECHDFAVDRDGDEIHATVEVACGRDPEVD